MCLNCLQFPIAIVVIVCPHISSYATLTAVSSTPPERPHHSASAMELHTITVGAISAIILGVIIDRAYQRLSHKWTNEPPLLPYRIPIIGHALWFGADCFGLYRTAWCVNVVPLAVFPSYIYKKPLREYFPDCKPYSLMFFGKRVYVRF